MKLDTAQIIVICGFCGVCAAFAVAACRKLVSYRALRRSRLSLADGWDWERLKAEG